jgi:hypothetical protein
MFQNGARHAMCIAGTEGGGLASHRYFFVRDDLADALGPQEIVEVPSVDLHK